MPPIAAACIHFGAVMLALWALRLVDLAARLFTAPVVRGIQLALGLIFLRKGFEFIMSGALFVDGRPGPFAAHHANLWLGVAVFVLVLALLDNRRSPAALVALAAGLAAGVLGGGMAGAPLALGPTELRLVLPQAADFRTAALLLVLPQIPLTIVQRLRRDPRHGREPFPRRSPARPRPGGRLRLHDGAGEHPRGTPQTDPGGRNQIALHPAS